MVSVAVSDTAANISTNLNALQTLAASGKLASIVVTNNTTPISVTYSQLSSDATALSLITGTYSLTVTGVTVANASSTLSQAHVASVSISDLAANVDANIASLQTMAAASQLVSVAFTDGGTPTLSFTATQNTSDTTAIGKFSGTYNLTITNVLAANAATVGAQSHVTSVLVADTGAHVVTSIAALETLSTKLTSISLTDSSTPTLNLTGAQLNSDATALGKITSAYNEFVTADAATTETLTATGTTNTISFTTETQGVTANLSTGTATTIKSGTTYTYTLHDFQNVTGSPYADTLTAGSSGALLTGDGGADTYVLNASGVDVAKDTAANLNGTTVNNFTTLDGLDFTNVAFGAGTTLGFVENGGNTAGTLTVSDGTHTAALLLLGQYAASSFQTVSDGGSGTVVAMASTTHLATILATAQS